ncbi:amidohydrolase [Geothermobacter hydrogeniphilus]|uniref:Amidohydrolase n=1 Tax=Geothermobacter hydrogeniphilus TaxID=1969733 RepID=A0A2K2H712_9BACT|nr:amidohydrolase family protein [Geothermobacter hydrogeniphilus]PNU19041.1 amidohydrolase [Geothermobacter hydrogeniphilus]
MGQDNDIIDVHCHCFAGPEQTELVADGLQRLRQAGIRRLAVMGLFNRRANPEDIWRLIPEGFPNLGDPYFNEVDTLLQWSRQQGDLLFPMIDTRCLDGDVPSLLQDYVEQGFRGIKGLYLADNGNDLNLRSIPDTFGISLKQYHKREWEIFAFAEARDLPVLYHMDARLYGDVMRAILNDFPQLRINFPHFGIGRRAFASILDHSPNVFTDIAYLRPHIRRNPASYADFIRHYPAQVCFGTDALLHQPQIVLDYIELVRSLQLPKEVEQAVFSANPRRFLGRAIEPRQEPP